MPEQCSSAGGRRVTSGGAAPLFRHAAHAVRRQHQGATRMNWSGHPRHAWHSCCCCERRPMAADMTTSRESFHAASRRRGCEKGRRPFISARCVELRRCTALPVICTSATARVMCCKQQSVWCEHRFDGSRRLSAALLPLHAGMNSRAVLHALQLPILHAYLCRGVVNGQWGGALACVCPLSHALKAPGKERRMRG